MKYDNLSKLLSNGRIIITEQRYTFKDQAFCAFFENYQQMDTLDDYLTGSDREWGDKFFSVCQSDWFPYANGRTPEIALQKLLEHINIWNDFIKFPDWDYRVIRVCMYMDKINIDNFKPFLIWDNINADEFNKFF